MSIFPGTRINTVIFPSGLFAAEYSRCFIRANKFLNIHHRAENPLPISMCVYVQPILQNKYENIRQCPLLALQTLRTDVTVVCISVCECDWYEGTIGTPRITSCQQSIPSNGNPMFFRRGFASPDSTYIHTHTHTHTRTHVYLFSFE